jgi:folate-binding protein YgfZ
MNHQTIIKVSGGDALDFLQGQLTNDLHRLDRGASMRCAWCSPKGRVICLFLVSMDEDGYSLLLPAELADNVLKRLTMFRFRAKVEFETEAAADGADLSELIRDGIPHIGSDQSEKFTAHMLNLDLLGAINFEKGCYTGQEIIARTHSKGATKRRALRFESAAPVSVGDKVSDGNRDIGEVLNVSGRELLAVIPVDKADGPLTVNGIKLTHLPLPYAIGPDSGPPRA